MLSARESLTIFNPDRAALATFDRPHSARSPADLKRLDSPAVLGMNAPPHNVAAAIIRIVAYVVRIVIVVVIVAVRPIDAADNKSPPVMKAITETGMNTGDRKAASLNSCGADRSRARKATAETAGSTTAEAAPVTAASATAMTTPTTTAARQSQVWREDAD
jgi:hypothetical protein